MKRILINATQSEELRVAMVNGQLLYDLDIEVPSREQKKSNIYKGIITRIEPGLEAAFVNYGADRHGFLPFKEISRQYFSNEAKDDKGRYNVKDAIKVDQEIIVQVEKEERGNKGAALTSFISLAGRFLVAMPQNPRAGGVSRRIEGEDREQVRKVMSELEMPSGMGVIARTAGVGRSTEEMQWDLDYLTQLWEAIEKAADEKKGPFLIYQESDIVIRALRDHYKSDVGEILIDSKKAYDRAHEFMSMVMPNAINKLKHFEDKLPLFNRFQIENQIESAFTRDVNLPSGGSIVIDHTEALISIDVNSARATKGGDIEETALNTNLEAADEVARQLRIRDLGGLVVIDFIDMIKNKNQREVEQRLRNAVYDDRARVQIGRISRFGLMEMSRQRLRPSLGESSQIVCPRCSGQGSIRDIESLSLAVLRLLEEEALKDNTGRVLAKLPVECATYLLNEKRNKIAGIEDRNKIHCVIIPDPNLETPHFEIERVRENDTHRHESSYRSSYEMTTEETPSYQPEPAKPQAVTPQQQPAVQSITPPAPKPQAQAQPVVEKNSEGFISRMFSALFGSSESKETEEEKPKRNQQQRNRRGNSRNRNRGNNQNRQRNNQNRNQNRNRKNDSGNSGKSQQAKGESKNQSNNQNQGQGQKSDNRNSNGNKQNNRRPRPQRNRNQQNKRADSQQTENRNSTQPSQNSQHSGNNAQSNNAGKEANSAQQQNTAKGNETRTEPQKPVKQAPQQGQSETRNQSQPAAKAESASKPQSDKTNHKNGDSFKPGNKSTTEKPKAAAEKASNPTPAKESVSSSAPAKPD